MFFLFTVVLCNFIDSVCLHACLIGVLTISLHCFFLLLQNLWLSAIEHQMLLPESLALVYDDVANTVLRQPDGDCSRNEPDSLLSEEIQQQLISYGELSVTRNEIFPCEELVSEHEDIDVESDTAVNRSRFLGTDHDRLYESICERVERIDNAATAEDITRKLCSLLKFFQSECLADEHYHSAMSTAFPFYVLDQYAETVGEDSVLGENSSSSNET